MSEIRKSDPMSIRLQPNDERFLRGEATRLHRPRAAVLEQYLAEAIRMCRFPGIAFRGDDHNRRAWLLGTGLDVWELIAILKDFGDEQEMARDYELSPGHIRIARAYYREFPEEIDDLLASARQTVEAFRLRNPFVATLEQSLDE